MECKLTPFLVSTPQDDARAGKYPFRLGHLAYKIHKMHLMRGPLASGTHGGAMVIGDIDTSTTGDFERLAGEIYKECRQRDFDLILLDLEAKPTGETAPYVGALCTELHKRTLNVFVPMPYAVFCPDAGYLVSTAVSGGSLREYLEGVLGHYDVSRIALELARICMDFPMPSATAEGKRLSRQELETIFQNTDAQSFYSPEMCVNYFTYADAAGQTHFVLFDDARSIADKIQLGTFLGVRTMLLLFPEVEDILPEISAFDDMKG